MSFNFHNSTTEPFVNIDWQIFKNLDTLWLRTVLSFLTSFGKQELINQTIDACHDRVGHGNVVTKVIFNEMKKYGNLTSKDCPLQPGYYYANKVWIAEEYFPIYVPHTVLELKFSMWTKINGEKIMLMKSLFETRIVERETT